jgi:aspartyl-tRNA(Asn)/glutamyl-tRNA(Gln) amidotransferase subunit A
MLEFVDRNPTTDTISRRAAELRSGIVTAQELTRAALERIERLNPVLNAVTTVTRELALAAAQRADRELRAGIDRGPLQGIPVGIKDVVDVRGVRVTMGSAGWQDYLAAQDATVVRRLRRRGAVVLGMLHTQELAYGATGLDSFTGPARNPHDLDRIPGGSSSGPAAAVAAGICFGSIGTDTGGSVRIPAALCGVVGLKPTAGRTSRAGVLPLSWSLDHVGVITRSVADNAAMLGVISGADRHDPYSVRRRPEDFTRTIGAGVRGLRIGVPSEYFETLDSDVASAVEKAVDAWQAMGATIADVRIRDLRRIVDAQRTVVAVEAYATHGSRLRDRPELLQDSVRQRLQDAGQRSAAEYALAREFRREAKMAFDESLADVDVLVTPTVPMPAPRVGEREVVLGRPEPVQSALTRLTGPTNFSGHPSLSVPFGRSRTGLPVGVQLIGRYWDEATLYRVGEALEAAT